MKLTRKQVRELKKQFKESETVESDSGSFSKQTLRMIFRDLRIFVVLILIVVWKTGVEPSSLVLAVFGFMSVEVWQLARIKVNNIKVDSLEEESDYGICNESDSDTVD